MRAKRAKALRKQAAPLVTNHGTPKRDQNGAFRWPVGSFRRIYKTLKREYKNARPTH